LTDDERRIMQEHPEAGQRVLAAMPFLKGAADVVRFHHERYDGTGYPRRLRGEEIPILARVFSVADVFDALTSNRPYHKKMDTPAAREEIRRESGKAFDPRVVEAFLSIPAQEWDEVRHAFPEC
jgi:HD-GYP domain-containing protein (c-di-GMP phosphodiesterase class II)